MVSSGDGACDGGLLLVVCEALACKEGGAALGDLDDNGGLDVTSARGEIRWRQSGDDGDGRYRAASRTEFATEEDVQFWKGEGEEREGESRERDVRWPRKWKWRGERMRVRVSA